MDYNISSPAKEEKKKIDYGYQMPDIDTPHEDLLKIAADWDKESKEYHDQLERIWTVNEAYYKGRQTGMDMIPRNMSNAVQNHIYMGIETIVPIITANSPKFIAEPVEESDTAIRYATAVEKTLSIIYEEKDVRSKGEMLMRHMLIYRFGAWVPFFNETTGEPDVEYVRPQQLYFPKTSKLFYFFRKKDYTTEEFIAKFTQKKYDEYLEKKGANTSSEKTLNNMHVVWEYHTKDITFYKCENYIIDVETNDLYNFEDKDKNFFDEARLPIIIASAFRLGSEPIGETDLIQQTISIQDTINVANRLIINNATKTGNAQWFVDSEVMTEEEARTKITNSPGLILYGSGIANQNKVRRDAPPPLPNYIAELKIMAERAFDNIFGTHATTRGERGESETLGGRMLLKQSDYGRIDLLVREYERCVSELGNWLTQIIKIKMPGEKIYRSYGESGNEFVRISADKIEKGLKVIIKSGTTLPTDEVSKRQEALELWAMGALDPVTLFERLKFPNPQDAAQKLMAFKQGQLQMEVAAQGTKAQPRENKTSPAKTGRGSIGAAAKNLGGMK